jgi:hypothetical protein
MVGSPVHARTLFAKIDMAEPGQDIGGVLRETEGSFMNRQPSERQEGPSLYPLADAIETICAAYPGLADIAEYQKWSHHVARFSFHTRDLTFLTDLG